MSLLEHMVGTAAQLGLLNSDREMRKLPEALQATSLFCLLCTPDFACIHEAAICVSDCRVSQCAQQESECLF